MAAYLESKGFKVLLLLDPDALNLKSSMVLFENKILRGSTVVVYFGGHGICTSFGGQHFLLPCNFRPPPPPPSSSSVEAGVELPIPGAGDSEFASQLSPSRSNVESANHKYLITHVSASHACCHISSVVGGRLCWQGSAPERGRWEGGHGGALC
jgi:hypothetical protein